MCPSLRRSEVLKVEANAPTLKNADLKVRFATCCEAGLCAMTNEGLS